jgi:hypothetical protein
VIYRIGLASAAEFIWANNWDFAKQTHQYLLKLLKTCQTAKTDTTERDVGVYVRLAQST